MFGTGTACVQLAREQQSALAMSCSAEAPIFELHGMLLRSVASATQLHFQGLSQASRYLRARGLVSSSAAKKLQNIDCAYNLCRHITSISSKSFADQVICEISHALSNDAGSTRENNGRDFKDSTVQYDIKLLPDIVDEERLVEEAAKSQSTTNPSQTLSDGIG